MKSALAIAVLRDPHVLPRLDRKGEGALGPSCRDVRLRRDGLSPSGEPWRTRDFAPLAFRGQVTKYGHFRRGSRRGDSLDAALLTRNA